MKVILLLLLSAVMVRADLLTRIDQFDSGLSEGWHGGLQAGGPGPVHTASGGPDDGPFLMISHSSFHIGTKNTSQWAGDYLSSSVTALRMDLKHLSGDPLDIRIVVFGSGGMWASRNLLSIDSTWNTYEFGLTGSDLVHVGGGTGTLNDTLANVSTLLVRHDRATPTPQGAHPPHVTAAMGMDNIHAVPEPGTLAYMVVAGGCVWLTRRRIKR